MSHRTVRILLDLENAEPLYKSVENPQDFSTQVAEIKSVRDNQVWGEGDVGVGLVFFKWHPNTHIMFNTEKYFYTQLFCSKTSPCICDKVCGSQSYNIVWGRHQTLRPSPSLLIIIVIYFILFFQSGTSWLQRSFLKFQMYRKILFSETVRKKAPVRGGSEQMEGTWRANRKWRLGGFLMLCWQQSKFHFPLLTLPTGAVSVCLFPPFIWHVAFWPQKLFLKFKTVLVLVLEPFYFSP